MFAAEISFAGHGSLIKYVLHDLFLYIVYVLDCGYIPSVQGFADLQGLVGGLVDD